MKVLVTDFSGTYGAEGFLQWLQAQPDVQSEYVDLTGLEGTCCYCDAEEEIGKRLPETLPLVRWIDSGDYHYMSHLLALREQEPFHLVLMDHHPDNQEAAFGGVLSCGSWVRAMQEGNPFLRDVLTLGPDGCPGDIPDGWLEARRGERVYVSLDKDVMAPEWARTDWTQGTHSLQDVLAVLRRILTAPVRLAAVDICGELPEAKGGRGEDLRVNLETNCKLQVLFNQYN